MYGHGGERVRESLAAPDLSWALQAEQLGTGHAVMQAMPGVPDDHLALILYGDVPMVEAATLRRLVETAGENSIAVLSVRMKDPTGYGRIVRDGARNVARIVEHKDANTKERAIDEVNTGLMAVPAKRLREWLGRLKNDNAQGEYYLTDVVVMAAKAGLKVHAVLADSEDEVLGVNDKLQLAEVEAVYRRRRATELMLQGVTLVDPTRFDARGIVEAGRDVLIDVNVVLEGKVVLGDRVRIGPTSSSRMRRSATTRSSSPTASSRRRPSARTATSARSHACVPTSTLAAGCAHRQLRRSEEQHPRHRQQGQSPDLPRRHDDRQQGERRRRHHHLQLRRRQQVAHRDRRRRIHRIRRHAGGAGQDRRRMRPLGPARRSPRMPQRTS